MLPSAATEPEISTLETGCTSIPAPVEQSTDNTAYDCPRTKPVGKPIPEAEIWSGVPAETYVVLDDEVANAATYTLVISTGEADADGRDTLNE